MRVPVLIVGFVVGIAACGSQPLSSMSLRWIGAGKSPTPSPRVAEAFAATPFSLTVRDARRDIYAVGIDEESGAIVRTRDSVTGFVTQHAGDLLSRAGARLREAPLAHVELELLELNVVEGGMFDGTVQMRVIVRRGGPNGWAQVYRGKSKRWGRSHSPENYNEALSNALQEATLRIVEDDAFGHALLAPPPAASSR